ncbi:MAG: hypothetical protein KAJ39_01075 [Gammaproteobacteria bacterium]|nr:hypothetical protein [Gammaproteobacteria bacterium]
MKIKTRFSLGLVTLLLMASVNAHASDGEGRYSGRTAINHEQIVKKLNLDDSTSKSLLELMNNHRSKHQERRDMSREQYHKMREQHREEVKALLGNEKFSRFKKMMRNKHKKQGNKECSEKHNKHQD